MFIGDTVSNVQNMTGSLKYATNLGVYSGGSYSNSGLDVTVTAGTGYLITGTIPNDLIKYIEWDEQTTTIASNDLSYIYINSAGTLQDSTSKPNEYSNIIICTAYSGASDVIYYQDIETNGSYMATTKEYTCRDALGPIVSSGLIATASATALKIDVTSGSYYYGDNKMTGSPSSNITFYTFYRASPSGWTRGSTDAVEAKYDNNSGTLQSVPSGDYVKHALYLNIDSAGTKTFFIVYGQEVFDSVASARTGNMPLVPTFFVE